MKRFNVFEIDLINRGARRKHRPLAPATYRFIQPGFGEVPSFDLWDLTENVPGHPAGSTVSSQTLLGLGYSLPDLDGMFHHGCVRGFIKQGGSR